MFRDRNYNDQWLSYDLASKRFISVDDDCLRWVFPKGTSPIQPMGVRWRLQVQGDFVITAKYEVLSAEGSNGVGFKLSLLLGNATQDEFAVSRLSRRKEGPCFEFSRAVSNVKNERVTNEFRVFPTTWASSRGQLRLQREGAILFASLGEGFEGRFKELHCTNIDTSGVQNICFAGIVGGRSTVQLDMRLLEFRIQADDVIREEKPVLIQDPIAGWFYVGIAPAIFGILVLFVFLRRHISMK